MHVFSEMMSHQHEQVVFGYDPDAGLRAIIAIHDTSLGPALGGTRMWPYRSEAEALNDVLRLSRGMTAKAAVAGLNLGGGKGVIIGDADTDKNEILFRAYGRLVQRVTWPVYYRRGRGYRSPGYGMGPGRNPVCRRDPPGPRR